MKNIIAIGVLSIVLVACKSTSGTTSGVTNNESTKKSTTIQQTPIENKTSLKVTVDKSKEIKEGLMVAPINKQQVKTISEKKVGEE